MNYSCMTLESPVGKLTAVANETALVSLLWTNGKTWPIPHLDEMVERPSHPVLRETEKQLGEYFAGTRRIFTLPVEFAGNDFQRKVWAALLTIPYGETRTYGEIAAQIGEEGAARAVGAANSRNPIPIIAPCHRVIGANGKLTGFAGGLENKAYLLDLEANDRLKLAMVA